MISLAWRRPHILFSRVSSQWPWSAVIDSLVYICLTIDNALLKFTPLLSQALGWGSRDACAVHWRHVCDSLTLSSFSAIGGKCWTWLTGWSQDVCCVTWLLDKRKLRQKVSDCPEKKTKQNKTKKHQSFMYLKIYSNLLSLLVIYFHFLSLPR